MFINQDTVAIAFKLINFFTLIGLSFFLFKKYIKSDLLILIAKRKAAQECLFTQQASLEKQQLDLDALLKEESVLCQNFRSNIDEWKKVVTLEQDLAKKEYDAALVAHKKRNATIALHQENQRIQTIVSDAVITDLQQSLSQHFKDEKKSTDYLNSILHFMDERIS